MEEARAMQAWTGAHSEQAHSNDMIDKLENYTEQPDENEVLMNEIVSQGNITALIAHEAKIATAPVVVDQSRKQLSMLSRRAVWAWY